MGSERHRGEDGVEFEPRFTCDDILRSTGLDPEKRKRIGVYELLAVLTILGGSVFVGLASISNEDVIKMLNAQSGRNTQEYNPQAATPPGAPHQQEQHLPQVANGPVGQQSLRPADEINAQIQAANDALRHQQQASQNPNSPVAPGNANAGPATQGGGGYSPSESFYSGPTGSTNPTKPVNAVNTLSQGYCIATAVTRHDNGSMVVDPGDQFSAPPGRASDGLTQYRGFTDDGREYVVSIGPTTRSFFTEQCP